MKKFLCITLSLFLLTGSLFSCQKNNGTGNDGSSEMSADTTPQATTKSYTIGEVLEAGPYDWIPFDGAKHRQEINLNFNDFEDFNKVNTTHPVVVNGYSLTGTYEETRQSPYYNGISESYIHEQNEYRIRYRINANDQKCDSFIITNLEYTHNESSIQKSRDECLQIAQEYLSQFVPDADQYVLIDEDHRNYQTIDPEYEFDFARKIGDLLTVDTFSVSVMTESGKIGAYSYQLLGEMRNVLPPDEATLEAAQAKVTQKLDTIYASMKEKYDLKHNVSKLQLSKMADGRLALEYIMRTAFSLQNGEESYIRYDISHLVVYLD